MTVEQEGWTGWREAKEKWMAAGEFPNPYRPGDEVTIRRGALTLTTNPHARVKMAGRAQRVMVIDVSPWQVYWRGRGGYWRWARYEDCER